MLEERIKTGARSLDMRRPGWASDINTRTLDMFDSFCCIHGQLFGDFSNYDFDGFTYQYMYDNGFTIVPENVYFMNDYPHRSAFSSDNPDWQCARELWIAEIVARR